MAYEVQWRTHLSYCLPLLTAGKDGSYGTSVERYKALDPASDIILAFKQNGRLLTPDHGYPLRIIIPGAPTFSQALTLRPLLSPARDWHPAGPFSRTSQALCMCPLRSGSSKYEAAKSRALSLCR